MRFSDDVKARPRELSVVKRMIGKVICPLEPAAEATGSQFCRPFAPVQLRLSCRWREDGDNGMGGIPGAVQQISWHLPYDWGKPQKTSVSKPSGALNCVTSHCFRRGPFPPDEVGRTVLLAMLAKPNRVWPERVLKNWDRGSEDPISGILPPGHPSKIGPGHEH